jgi:hypothetical protein
MPLSADSSGRLSDNPANRELLLLSAQKENGEAIARFAVAGVGSGSVRR